MGVLRWMGLLVALTNRDERENEEAEERNQEEAGGPRDEHVADFVRHTSLRGLCDDPEGNATNHSANDESHGDSFHGDAAITLTLRRVFGKLELPLGNR